MSHLGKSTNLTHSDFLRYLEESLFAAFAGVHEALGLAAEFLAGLPTVEEGLGCGQHVEGHG